MASTVQYQFAPLVRARVCWSNVLRTPVAELNIAGSGIGDQGAADVDGAGQETNLNSWTHG